MEMKRTRFLYKEKLCMILIHKILFTKKNFTVFMLKHVLQHNIF